VGDTEFEDDREPPPARPRIRVTVKPKIVSDPDTPPTIHLFSNGTQTGPFTATRIQQMLRSGEIPLDALYWSEGMEDWRQADELSEPGTT